MIIYLFTDATVTIDAMVNPSEADGSVDVCVNPGITGEVQADLTVTLEANNGKASECCLFV